MKVIFSHVVFENSRNFCNLEMAKISNNLVQKHGYKTCLYTDEYGYKLLHKNIKYDQIILFEKEKLNILPRKIWSFGKILAMSMVSEPFIHIDFDLLMLNDIDKKILNNDFFVLHKEPLINNNTYKKEFNEINKIYNMYPNKNEISNNINCYNFGIIGGRKFLEIQNVCNKIINFYFLYKKQIDFLAEKTNPDWLYPVIFEQILIPNFLNKIYNINPTEILKISENQWDNLDIKLITDKLSSKLIENGLFHLDLQNLNLSLSDKIKFKLKNLQII
jgi:hypothetical protein